MLGYWLLQLGLNIFPALWGRYLERVNFDLETEEKCDSHTQCEGAHIPCYKYLGKESRQSQGTVSRLLSRTQAKNCGKWTLKMKCDLGNKILTFAVFV